MRHISGNEIDKKQKKKKNIFGDDEDDDSSSEASSQELDDKKEEEKKEEKQEKKKKKKKKKEKKGKDEEREYSAKDLFSDPCDSDISSSSSESSSTSPSRSEEIKEEEVSVKEPYKRVLVDETLHKGRGVVFELLRTFPDEFYQEEEKEKGDEELVTGNLGCQTTIVEQQFEY